MSVRDYGLANGKEFQTLKNVDVFSGEPEESAALSLGRDKVSEMP
ncbi:MAG TPA: hypothetical protein VFM79_02445 [Pelobium sp.]|nr:hypothetical protein [Pelobium sp.]